MVSFPNNTDRFTHQNASQHFVSSKSPEEAAWKLMNYQPKTPFLERTVSWYKKVSTSSKGNETTAAKIIRISLAVFASLLLVTIPFIIKFHAKLHHSQQVEQFYCAVKAKVKPNIASSIMVNTKTRTFNHVASYAIHDGIIWVKPHEKYCKLANISKDDQEWKPIYFDGWPRITPAEIRADGANLIVIDEKGGVHYKKVIKERFDGKQKHYFVYDKSTKDNWKNTWFTLPCLHSLVNLFTGKRLYLPSFTKKWAISHRGQYNHYIEDRYGNPHPVSQGVTTLYILDKSGSYIYLFDPWKPKNVLMRIPIPGTASSRFVAENISVSCSTIMAIGYRYEKSTEGKIVKKPQILTMIADIDSLGWNPTIKYSYFQKKENLPREKKDSRILPTAPKGWGSHELPDGEISSEITILQTGEGNNSREMRIIGKKNGQIGYWFKTLYDENQKWQFKRTSLDVDYKKMEEKAADKAPEPIVSNWSGQIKNISVKIDDFNHECIHKKVHVGGIDLLLHRQENIILKILSLGKKFHNYDLVLLEEYQKSDLPKQMQKFFKRGRVIPVKVVKKKKGEMLYINDRRLFRNSGLKINLGKQ